MSVDRVRRAVSASLRKLLILILYRVDIYFVKVHCFVPILHKPQFMERYIFRSQAASDIGPETSLLLHCMLSLAARFSKNTSFKDIHPIDRGEQFARKAQEIYRNHQPLHPSLEFLQGCILLAWYHYLSGPDSQGWLLVGMCTRLAHDLGIEKTDRLGTRTTESESPVLWRTLEERRRAWWSVWELDTFASAVSCRPHSIDRIRVVVKLPVSDENWFSDTPLDSPVVDPDPLHAWHALCTSPNQDERAWFLVSNYLLLIAHELLELDEPSAQSIGDIERAVCCFDSALPPQYRIDGDAEPIAFNSTHFAKWNWVICTNIMIQGYEMTI